MALQPGDLVYWKRHKIKDSLQPYKMGPYQVLLTIQCAAKLKGVKLLIHISHFKNGTKLRIDIHSCL